MRANVSGVHPNLGAVAAMAAHWEVWWGTCSRTNRTARSRTSGLNRRALAFDMAPSSHKVEPPVIPGRFSSWWSALLTNGVRAYNVLLLLTATVRFAVALRR